MGRFWLAAIVILPLSGCASFTTDPSPIVEVAMSEQVKGCQRVGSFKGPDGYRMWGTPYGGNFRVKSLGEAVKMGATHMWWTTAESGLSEIPVGYAYRCPEGYSVPQNDGEE